MNPLFMVLAAVLVLAQFALPRRFAFAPLLVAICHFQSVPVIEVGVSFSICKLVIMAGLLRAARDHTQARLTRQPLDVIIAVWAGWMILSGFAHHPKDHNPITIRLSVVFDFVGSYLYARSFLRDRSDFLRCAKCLALVMVPLAVETIAESAMHQNYYGLISGKSEEVEIRAGRVRAAGPFSHSILLGTFAATSIPLLIPLWHQNRRRMIVGIAACAVIVLCSASSGPIMTLFCALFGVALWRWRGSMAKIRTLTIIGIVMLQLVMQAPVWYLMARVDLTGGSTGWYRAALIDTALDHLNEWWLVGTDHTRHWLGSGVIWSQYQIDITNYYVAMGVTGGLLLMLCFIVILIKAFQSLGRGMISLRLENDPDEFMLWCVGAALLAHSFAFISVSYFDQSNAAFSFVLGAVSGLAALSATVGSPDIKDQWQADDQGGAVMAPHEC